MSNESMEKQLAVMANDLSYIKGDIKVIKEELEGKYVTHDQFEPIRRLVYGSVAVILTAVLGAIIALVLK